MIEKEKISDFCIYTMRKRDHLQHIYISDRSGTFTEKKNWRTGNFLLKQAEEKNLKMPIFFSASDENSGLIYFAFLDSIEIDEKETIYSFSNLTELKESKPLSRLFLRNTNKPLSDSYIRPYAICKTPELLIDWAQEAGFAPVKKTRKTGLEMFHKNGNELDFSLLDFWQWSASDLVNNALRGVLAEFIVAKSLNIEDTVRSGWDAYDLLLPNGIKIEVKSAAYVQSWFQKNLSKISFGIGKTRKWTEKTNHLESESRRQADIYVFCLLNHKIQETIDPLNTNQWEFYVLPAYVLNDSANNQKQISLSSLKKLKPLHVKYEDLSSCIDKMASGDLLS